MKRAELPDTLKWASYPVSRVFMETGKSLRGECHIYGLVQERRNSSALAMELRLSCINPSTYSNIRQEDFLQYADPM